MLHYNDFSAWITVDDEPVEEYDPQIDEESNTVTCWIASEVGKSYKVHWRDEDYRSPTRGTVWIDGHRCGGTAITQADAPSTCCKEGLYTTATSYKPFTFSNVKTSDDNSLLAEPSAPDVGLIKIAIQNVEVQQIGVPFQNREAPGSKTFHEKTKKMINHQTNFDQPQVVVSAVTRVRTKPLGPPFAIFHFRYRPLDILQAQDIAPRAQVSPTPARDTISPVSTRGHKRVKGEVDSDVETVNHSDEESGEEDAKLIESLQQQLDHLKKRFNRRQARKKVKREPGSAETIDLTLDD